MSQNQKIKSITITQLPVTTYTDSLYCSIMKDGDGFRIETPSLILIANKDIVTNIEYEKPKNKALFEIVKPEIGVKYHWIDTWGDVRVSVWRDNMSDNHLFSANNAFLPKENAQKQADKIKLLAEIDRFAVENNDEIDFTNHGSYKFTICYDYYEAEWCIVDTCNRITLAGVYFSSKTLATQALEKFKDRLDILLD